MGTLTLGYELSRHTAAEITPLSPEDAAELIEEYHPPRGYGGGVYPDEAEEKDIDEQGHQQRNDVRSLCEYFRLKREHEMENKKMWKRMKVKLQGLFSFLLPTSTRGL